MPLRGSSLVAFRARVTIWCASSCPSVRPQIAHRPEERIVEPHLFAGVVILITIPEIGYIEMVDAQAYQVNIRFPAYILRALKSPLEQKDADHL